MKTRDILESPIFREAFICDYCGRIESIKIDKKNECESRVYMNMYQGNGDNKSGWSFLTSFQVISSSNTCGEYEKVQDMRFNETNMPIYGPDYIYSKTSPVSLYILPPNPQPLEGIFYLPQGDLLNVDCGIKYRFNSHIITNTDVVPWIQGDVIPTCKESISQEYGIYLFFFVWLLLFVYSFYKVVQKYFFKKSHHKK